MDASLSHHVAAPLFGLGGREEEEQEHFSVCGPRVRSRHAVASRVSSLALALSSSSGLSLQPGDRVAILASPSRVLDESEEEEEVEARRRRGSGLDASPSSSPRPSSPLLSPPPPPRSTPLFPADAAFEALLAAAAAGGVACPINGRLPPESVARLLASLRPRAVLVVPGAGGGGRRAAEAAVAEALATAALGISRGGGGFTGERGGGGGGEAFFGLPRGPEAPVVVWLDDGDGDGENEDDEGGPSPLSSPTPSPPPFAQVSSSSLLRKVARDLPSSPEADALFFAPRFAPNDAAAIVFTSGTESGEPRGALLTHSALHFQSRVKTDRMELCSADSVLHAAPLFHVAGLSAAAAALLARCRKNVFLESGGWTRRGGWRAATEGEGVTALSVVSAMVFDLAAENEREGKRRREAGGKEGNESILPLSSVRVALVGGGAPPAAKVLATAFPNPRVRILTAYGLTEASSSVLWGEVGVGKTSSYSSSLSPSSPPSSSFAASAAPPPGVEVAVAVFESTSPSLSWRPARDGEEGELLTRGPHVFRGYWRDAAAMRAALLFSSPSSGSTTAAAAAAETKTLPWLRTGDAAVRSSSSSSSGNGSIRVLGRGADAIRVGGETVHASSVEASLQKSFSARASSSSSSASRAGVLGIAVVGLPHARLGQVVAVLVALDKGIAWRGDVAVIGENEKEEEEKKKKTALQPPPPPPSAGCGVGLPGHALSLSTLRAAGRAAGLPGHALPRHAVATWADLPKKGPLAKLDRGEALRLVERAVGRSREEEEEDKVGEQPRPRL